eukprot:1159313-Pelagomonas_calceolata.AAC.3
MCGVCVCPRVHAYHSVQTFVACGSVRAMAVAPMHCKNVCVVCVCVCMKYSIQTFAACDSVCAMALAPMRGAGAKPGEGKVAGAVAAWVSRAVVAMVVAVVVAGGAVSGPVKGVSTGAVNCGEIRRCKPISGADNQELQANNQSSDVDKQAVGNERAGCKSAAVRSGGEHRKRGGQQGVDRRCMTGEEKKWNRESSN